MTLSTLLLVVEGLTRPEDPLLGRLCPVLERLAGVGVTGRVASTADGTLVGRIFSPESVASRVPPPVGYLSAVGLGMAPDPARTWARMEFAHLMQIRDRLVFVAPERIQPQPAERFQLVQSMVDVLADAGWSLHPTPDHLPMLISTPRSMDVVATSPEHLDGASFLDHHPKGSDALALLGLVTHGQMMLARHVVNRQRLDAGLLPLNTPWIWGVGDGTGWPSVRFSQAGRCWSQDAAECGMAIKAGFSALVAAADEDGAGWRGLLDWVLHADPVPGLIVLRHPARLARAGRGEERLRWLSDLDQAFLAPLTAALAASNGRLLVAGDEGVAGQGAPWVMAQGRRLLARRWFWNNQSMGQGGLADPDALRKQWLE